MKLILCPESEQTLENTYDKAFKEATEVIMASAYLTDWPSKRRLSEKCRNSTILIGTDFGLTRKAALKALLKCIPKHSSVLLLAVPKLSNAGFHPKIVAWKTPGGSYNCLLGSSNLSKAAFNKNFEANVFSSISKNEFERIQNWLEEVAETAVPITEDWIDNHYVESRIKVSPETKRPPAIKLKLPAGKVYSSIVAQRRKQQQSFKEISKKLFKLTKSCADRKLKDSEYWEGFWGLWATHESRFQGSGIQFTGKSAIWNEACSALVEVINNSKSLSRITLDHLVSEKIDWLAQCENPARKAWFSEMLCHYFPDRYPVLNSPVKKWLAANKWRGRRGASEGQRYIELALQLREAVRQKAGSVKNLAELDAVIWKWGDLQRKQ